MPPPRNIEVYYLNKSWTLFGMFVKIILHIIIILPINTAVLVVQIITGS